MRAVALMLIVVAGLPGSRAKAGADAPAIVIPGRPGVPVIINGGDASYCVVEGDWGLARPGHVPVTVVACPNFKPIPDETSYFPAFGRKPGYGRLEIEPPPDRKLPPPAPSYYREWSTHSDRVPASADPPAHVEINVEPRTQGRRRERPQQDAQPPDRMPSGME
jgi:hypothetical protein